MWTDREDDSAQSEKNGTEYQEERNDAIQNMNHNDEVLNGNGDHEFVSSRYDNVEVDFCVLAEGHAMEIYVGELLHGLDFSRGRDDVVGMGYSDLHDGGVGMRKAMNFCCHHHYNGSDV